MITITVYCPHCGSKEVTRNGRAPNGKQNYRCRACKLPAWSETLIPPDANDIEATVLELDGLWSFVLKKTNQAWIWIALCRETRQVVAYASREIAVKRPAAVCGKPFLKHIVEGIATQIFGMPDLGGDSGRATYSGRKGNRANGSCRTLE